MRVNKYLINIVLLTLSGVIYSANVYSQNTAATADKDKTEVISIRGQKPLGFYREEMVDLKFEFYDLLNAVNTKAEFKIKCEKKSTVETRVKETVCEPQYVIDMRAKLNQQKSQASEFTGAAITQISDKELNKQLQSWHDKADQEKLRLMTTNPKLKAHFLKLIKSEENYKRLHVATYGSMSNYYKEEEQHQESSNP